MNDGIPVRWTTRMKHELLYRTLLRTMHLDRAGFPERDSVTETNVHWLIGVPA